MCQILKEYIRTNKKMIDERSCYRIPSRGSKMREADRLPIGSSATCASSYRSRQTPTDHAQSFSRRIVDINPVSHASVSLLHAASSPILASFPKTDLDPPRYSEALISRPRITKRENCVRFQTHASGTL